MTGRGPLRIDWGVAVGALLFLLVGGGFAIFGGYQLANTRAFLQAAFPVVVGLFLVALVGFIEGGTFSAWILAKTTILFLTMLTSYGLARGAQQQ